MGRSRKNGRIYWRSGRAWGDFRDYADVGGGQEALRPTGQRWATTDPDVAADIAAARVKELEQRRRSKSLLGLEAPAEFAEFAAFYLDERARTGNGSERWLAQIEKHLAEAADFFGAHRMLDSIGVRDVRRYLAHLKAMPSSRGGTVGTQVQRHYIMSLSGLFEFAQGESRVPPGHNPVKALRSGEIPSVTSAPARWLEAPDVALLLESARTYRPPKDKHAIPYAHALLATFALTGGRKSEILGLEVGDISFDRGTITIAPNGHRDLKTRTSHRQVRLWPQLRAILQEHVFGRAEPVAEEGLLFPSPRTGGMLDNFDTTLDVVAEHAGFPAGGVRTKDLRHSYCAARLQTTERGAPVSPWIVAKEMGHGGRSLVDKVYGHISHRAPRGEVVEFDPDALLAELKDRAREEAEAGDLTAAKRLKAEADAYERRLRDLRTRPEQEVDEAEPAEVET